MESTSEKILVDPLRDDEEDDAVDVGEDGEESGVVVSLMTLALNELGIDIATTLARIVPKT